MKKMHLYIFMCPSMTILAKRLVQIPYLFSEYWVWPFPTTQVVYLSVSSQNTALWLLTEVCQHPKPRPFGYWQTSVSSHSVKINKPKAIAYKRKIWLYDQGNYEDFRLKLNSINWHDILQTEDLDTTADIITNSIIDAASATIPNKVVTIRPNDIQCRSHVEARRGHGLVPFFTIFFFL